MWGCILCISHRSPIAIRQPARRQSRDPATYPERGIYAALRVHEPRGDEKGGEPIVAKGKYQQWLEPDGLVLLEGWARDGLTDEQIAHNMGISTATLYDWKNKFQDISETLKKGKEVVDYEVENALLNKALGGDTTAQIFWLKNRRPDKWRDKPEAPGDADALKRARELLGGIPSAID